MLEGARHDGSQLFAPETAVVKLDELFMYAVGPKNSADWKAV